MPSTERLEKERSKAIEMAVDQIEKQFGKGSIMRLGGKGSISAIESIPTGSISIDYALGVGGVPRGRVTEIYGPEASGKTTLALQIIANAQATGGNAAFVDAEHALDPVYSTKLGVDLDNLLVSQPDHGEQALEIVETLVRSGAVDVVVVDSVAALVPRAEIEGEMGDSQMGLQARLMSQALRKLTGVVAKSNTCLIFINQLREKIGVMFGNPETTTGGRALKFYSSVRIDIRRIGAIKDADRVVGGRTRVKLSRIRSPHRFASQNSTLCTVRESLLKATYSISPWNIKLSRKAGRGSHTVESDSGKAVARERAKRRERVKMASGHDLAPVEAAGPGSRAVRCPCTAACQRSGFPTSDSKRSISSPMWETSSPGGWEKEKSDLSNSRQRG